MYLFIASHIGSGCTQLTESLQRHPQFHWSHHVDRYVHGSDLLQMKTGNWKHAKILFDQLLYNFTFYNYLFRFCRFIYLVAPPEVCILELWQHYKPRAALRYYAFRLRRLLEMMHRSPPSLFLTYDDLRRPQLSQQLQEFTGVRKEIHSPETFEIPQLDVDLTDYREVYDYYLSRYEQFFSR